MSNPTLGKLGYSKDDRLVIIHADDIGMCNASIEAFAELVDVGLISSGATMVPSSWFPKVASFCRQTPKIDMGVHLTLTSEWDNYRWSPISTCLESSGLIDDDGYFYHSTEDVHKFGKPEAVQVEIKTQVDRALKAGIDISHIDTHMLTVAHPKFIPAYVQLAVQRKLPFLFPRQDEVGFINLGLDADTAKMAVNLVAKLDDLGMPLVDHATGLNLDKPVDRREQAMKAISELKPGITHFVIHPSKESAELKAISPDWQSRVADFSTFMDEKLKRDIHNLGIQIIGYKDLKALLKD